MGPPPLPLTASPGRGYNWRQWKNSKRRAGLQAYSKQQ